MVFIKNKISKLCQYACACFHAALTADAETLLDMKCTYQ